MAFMSFKNGTFGEACGNNRILATPTHVQTFEMSMLAEPRSRQKWSDDPRNTRWASGE